MPRLPLFAGLPVATAAEDGTPPVRDPAAAGAAPVAQTASASAAASMPRPAVHLDRF
ncbi:MAG: hypothetical protein JO368_05750 [Acidimicrobiales bacterium]|nr:hypothetical protein [Acidimicrobiales bacterium]